jgi:acetyltransferase-like isoleucine patch superfamily enzyme
MSGDTGAGRWLDGELPRNVRLGPGTVIQGAQSFKRFHSGVSDALEIGPDCTLDNVHLAVGPAGRIVIGRCCYLCAAVLLAEAELRFGDYVMVGWNTVIADTDFHPLDPAQRVADAVACSPLGQGRPRPPIARQPVVIGDDVWIGPAVTILKGVRIGNGSWIEPGTLVTRDVPARARVAGNPGRVVGEV